LFKLGLPLGELWHLTPLAQWLRQHGRHAFFLTAAPMYVPGLVGAPVNPIATV
ncbi:MAG: cyclase family protein, partial [Achromobacter piechaudii]